MKIGVVVTTFPCRSETFFEREMEGLRALGFDIVVFSAAREDGTGSSESNMRAVYRPKRLSLKAVLSVLYLFTRHPAGLRRLFMLVWRLLKVNRGEAISLLGNLHTVGYFSRHAERAELSHIHAYFSDWPGVIGLALATITGKEFSISAHARDIFVENGDLQLKVHNAQFVRTCTFAGLRHLRNKLPARYHRRLHVVYHGMRTAYVGSNPAGFGLEHPHVANIVLAVGRMVEKKGFECLLRAFRKVLCEGCGGVLVFAGDGEGMEGLKGLARELMPEEKVHFLGWQRNEVILRLMQEATIVVVPSNVSADGDRDGIPNVILEAFVSGTAVVASDLVSIREAVRDRQTGLLFAAGDADSLAAAIRRLLEDPQLRMSLCHNAYEKAARCFDTSRNVRHLARLLRGGER